MSDEVRVWNITSLDDNDDGPDVQIIGPNAHLVDVIEKSEFDALLADARKLVEALELYDTYTDVLGGQTVAREAISEWNKKWGEK